MTETCEFCRIKNKMNGEWGGENRENVIEAGNLWGNWLFLSVSRSLITAIFLSASWRTIFIWFFAIGVRILGRCRCCDVLQIPIRYRSIRKLYVTFRITNITVVLRITSLYWCVILACRFFTVTRRYYVRIAEIAIVLAPAVPKLRFRFTVSLN